MFGLKVERTTTRGWSQTSLNRPATEAIKRLNIDEGLFQGLKRRVSAPKAKRYVSLVVDLEAMDNIETIKDKLATASGKKISQKHVVQQALQLLNDYVS